MNQKDKLDFSRALDFASNAFKQNEKFSLPVLAARAEKHALLDPNDTALNMAANILKRMASRKLFISRADLNKLYESLYKGGTRLKEVFAAELDRPALATPVMMEHQTDENAGKLDYDTVADSYLSNALAGIFENKETLFSKQSADRASNVTKLVLSSLNRVPKSVSTFAGRDGFILCTASYETSKGDVSLLIPVEMNGDKAMMPTMIISQKGFVDISKEAIDDHISEMAGRTFKVNSSQVFDALKLAKKGMPETLDEVDLALMKFKQASQTSITGGILLKELPKGQTAIEMPKVALPEPDQKFVDSLNSPRGEANFLFGEKTVSAGANFIQRKMAEFGFKSAQVSVASVADDSVSYAVVVSPTKAINVPVKIENKTALPPSIAVSKGRLAKFNMIGVSELLAGECDNGAIFSRAYDLQPAELLDQAVKAYNENNQSMLEETMNVLATKDIVSYKKALDYIGMRNNPEYKVATQAHTCTRILKSAAHSEPLCGHLNLPLSKVYQDDKGYCRPLHRRGHEEGSDEALFVAAKLLGTL